MLLKHDLCALSRRPNRQQIWSLWVARVLISSSSCVNNFGFLNLDVQYPASSCQTHVVSSGEFGAADLPRCEIIGKRRQYGGSILLIHCFNRRSEKPRSLVAWVPGRIIPPLIQITIAHLRKHAVTNQYWNWLFSFSFGSSMLHKCR